jgi:2-amino-4-hydroxy-6-hydroxymethyldihydropteridine diphosphokinase
MATLALIALGSNMGDRRDQLDRAVTALASTTGIDVRAVSAYHETAPVGGPGGQGAFLNAAAALVTQLDPQQLLRHLHEVERQAGRVRTVTWGARTLDLDLLLHGDIILGGPDVQVPHPRMAVRRFVLAPLVEVAPEVVDPLTRHTMRELLANLDRKPRCVAISGWPTLEQKALLTGLAEALGPVAEGGVWVIQAGPSPIAPTFVAVPAATAGPRRPPPRPTTPVLCIEAPTTEGALAEVLAACQAAVG